MRKTIKRLNGKSKAVISVALVLYMLLSLIPTELFNFTAAAAGNKIIYVRVTGTGSRNGTSWSNAYSGTQLQAAIEECAAAGGGEVRVGAGTYKPTMRPNITYGPELLAMDETLHFSLRNGVKVIGGFSTSEGTSGTPTLNNRSTILSGDLGPMIEPDDTNFPDGVRHVFHLFYHPRSAELDNTAELQNVMVTEGDDRSIMKWDNIFYENLTRGMVYNDMSSPTFTGCYFTKSVITGVFNVGGSQVYRDCVFSENKAYGAMYNRNYASTLIINSTFENNAAMFEYASGGAVNNDILSVPSFIGCTFKNNHAERNGGAMSNGIAHAYISGCTFTGNTAAYGGAIHSEYSRTKLTIDNSVFTENEVSSSGGAIMLSGKEDISPHSADANTANITNCEFYQNKTKARFAFGSAVYVQSANISITDCVFRKNYHVPPAGAGFNGLAFFANNSLVRITGSLFSENGLNEYTSDDGPIGDAVSISQSDAFITGCKIINNTGTSIAGLRVSYSRAWITNCLIAGNVSKGFTPNDSRASTAAGAGIYSSTCVILNSTITGNRAEIANNIQAVGGIILAGSRNASLPDGTNYSDIRFTNSIIAGNSNPGSTVDANEAILNNIANPYPTLITWETSILGNQGKNASSTTTIPQTEAEIVNANGTIPTRSYAYDRVADTSRVVSHWIGPYVSSLGLAYPWLPNTLTSTVLANNLYDVEGNPRVFRVIDAGSYEYPATSSVQGKARMVISAIENSRERKQFVNGNRIPADGLMISARFAPPAGAAVPATPVKHEITYKINDAAAQVMNGTLPLKADMLTEEINRIVFSCAATGENQALYILKVLPLPKASDFIVVDNSYTYDGNKKSARVYARMAGDFTVTYGGQSDGLGSSNTDPADFKPVNAGTYPIFVSKESANNYAAITNLHVGDLVISKANGTAVTRPTATNITYNSITVQSSASGANPGNQIVEYAISTTKTTPTDPAAWQESSTFNGLNEFTEYFLYVRAKENKNYKAGSIATIDAKTLDAGAPLAEVKYKTNGFNSFMNTVTFEQFFKKDLTVTVKGIDNGVGMRSISYYKASAPVSDYTSITGWVSKNSGTPGMATLENSFTVSQNEKFILYVRVEDRDRNIAYYKDGVVVYTDSTAVTDSVSHTKLSGSKTATVTLNGNTIAKVNDGSRSLTYGTDYSVSGETITFTGAYLDSLAAGDYTLYIHYNPLGEVYPENPPSYSEPHAPTTINLTVNLVTQTLTLNGAGNVYTYGAAPFDASLSGVLSSGAIRYEISEGTDVASISGGTVTIKKAGKFKIKGSVAGDGIYAAAYTESGEILVNEARPTVTVSGDNVSSYGGDALLNVTVSGEGETPQGSVTLWEDANQIGTAQTLSNGKASFTVATPDVGEHNYTVKYSGQNGYYTAATGVHNIGVAKNNQTGFSIIPVTATYGDTAFYLTTMGGQAGAVSFSVPDDNVISITPDGEVTIKNAGTVNVTATRAGDATYNSISATFILTVNRRDISEANVKVNGTYTYTGSQIMPNFTVDDKVALNTDDYTNTYGANVNAGTGTSGGSIILTGQKNYTGSKTVNFDIAKASQTAQIPTVVTRDVNSITVTAAKESHQTLEFAMNITNTSPVNGWQANDTFDGLSEYTEYYFFARVKESANYLQSSSSTGLAVKTLDMTIPTATVQYKTNSFKAFLNTISFGLFFKQNLDVTIKGDDASGSGVKEVAYYKAAADIGNPAIGIAAGDWITETGDSATFTVMQNEKFILYVRVTDNDGNISYYMDGIVIYTDSVAVTTEINHTKMTGDKTATVELNDNTIARINDGSRDLTPDTEYTVSGETITFKSSYLDNLTAGSYALYISYNPMNVIYSGADSRSELPAVTTITLNVGLAAQTLTINGAGSAYTYGAGTFDVSLAGKLGTGATTYSLVENTGAASIFDNTVTIVKAGTFKIKASVAADGKYAAAETITGVITVNEATPTVTVTGSNVSYGKNVTLNVSVTGAGVTPLGTVVLKEGMITLENKTLSNGEASFTITIPSVGDHSYTVEYSGQKDYYTAATDTRTIGVGKTDQAALTVNSVGAKTYGDAGFNLSTVGGSGTGGVTYTVPNDDIISVTSGGAVTIRNAGTVTVTATKAGDNNYNEITSTLDITVSPRNISNISITVTGDTTYTGAQLQPIFTVKDGTIAINGGDYTNTYGTNLNAGINGGSITLTGQRNYTGTKTVNFDIAKATQTALTVVGGNLNKTYGDAGFTLATSGGSSEAVTWASSHPTLVEVNAVTGAVTLKAATNGTTVTITATKAGGQNYIGTSAQITVTVDKRLLTVTADNKFRVYGAANPAFTVSYSGFAPGENENNLKTKPTASAVATAMTNVGTVPISVSGGAADNYIFDYKAGMLTITAAGQTPISIQQGASLSKTYGDGGFKLTTAGGSGTGAVTWSSDNTSLVTVDNSGNVTIKGATPTVVTITVTKAADTNHVETSASIQIMVNKKKLDVTVKDEQKSYGEANPHFTISYNGFVLAENENNLKTKPTASTTATATTSVGSYTIIVSGGVSGNYEFEYHNGTLIINKSGETVFKLNNGSDIRKTYGDGAFSLGTNGANGAITYESKNTSVATIDDNGEVTIIGAGEAQIFAYDAGDSNYEPATAAITLTVDKKSITVTAENKQKYFGDADPSLTYIIDPDLISGDSLIGTLKCEGSNVGIYDIVEDIAFSNNNYEIAFVKGTMTIKQTLSMQEVIDKINSLPNPIKNWDDADIVADVTNAYGHLTDDEKDQIPDDVKEKLKVAQEQSSEVNLRHNNVTVSAQNLPWGIRVIATPVPKSDPRYNAFFEKLTDKKLITLYDISLLNTLTGNKYTLPVGETVTVEIGDLILTGAENVVITHEKKDGTVEFITGTVSGNKITFTASDFSLYGIAANADKKPNPTKPVIPGTGDNSNMTLWLLTALISLGAVLSLTVGRKRRCRKGKK